MKEFFGSNARLKIRQSGSHIALAPDLKASRKARARWSVGIWKRIVEFANVIYPGEIDTENVVQLVSELDLSRRAPSIWEPEPSKLDYGIAEEAREVRQQVENILCWIAKPGEDTERDRLAVKTISEHYRGVNIELVEGHVVSRSFRGEHFLDSISRFVYDSLQQMSEDLALLPQPSPIRICATQHCRRFFVRDGKHMHCEKHSGAKAYRSTDENRRYKFIRDNLRIPVHKLGKKIASGRVQTTRDGAWKEKCLIQIHTDRTKRVKKRPIDYLLIG